MVTGEKYPGHFEAALSLLCLGTMIALSRFHTLDIIVYVAIMIILWAFSWGAAISALRHGDERGGLLGLLALVSVILVNVLGAMELLPALFVRSGDYAYMDLIIWRVTLVCLFLVLPQLVAFGGRAFFKWGCLPVCIAASATFFGSSVVLFMYFLENNPSGAAEPYCGQWMAGFPGFVVIGCAAHALLAAGALGCYFVFDTIRWWWAFGSEYMVRNSNPASR